MQASELSVLLSISDAKGYASQGMIVVVTIYNVKGILYTYIDYVTYKYEYLNVLVVF